ncbi:restriction endonuclease subunit S [Leyella stercorea]|uniref:restriction endonuclease subunit S n=1 Tax=Leyella stercorea TaxID=363265 RepID=UPI001F3C9C7E|nr:restriction endonuclease subunit S [Leyella stercorea]
MRFPEFREEWEEHELSEYLDFKNGLNPKPNQFGKGIKFISVMDILNNAVITYDCIRASVSVSEEDMSAFSVQKGDILFQRSSETLEDVGRANVYVDDIPAVFGGFVIRGKQKTNYNPLFFKYLLSSPLARKRIIRMGAGAQHFNIGQEGLSKVKLPFACIDEQNKIAKILYLLDKRISLQSKIIDKLQTLIKGIVDSTILRKEKNAIVGDVCSISEQIRAESNIDDIITVRLHGNGVCKSSAENLQLGATQYYRRRAGQLIYGKQNFHNGAIGIVPISLDNGITSKDIPSFDIDEMKCNSVYLLAQLQSPQYYKPAEALTTGTGSKRLKEETFLKMPIVLPNKREQDNIATLIISISANLDQAKKMLDLFSIQKQYLLRQMFI